LWEVRHLADDDIEQLEKNEMIAALRAFQEQHDADVVDLTSPASPEFPRLPIPPRSWGVLDTAELNDEEANGEPTDGTFNYDQSLTAGCNNIALELEQEAEQEAQQQARQQQEAQQAQQQARQQQEAQQAREQAAIPVRRTDNPHLSPIVNLNQQVLMSDLEGRTSSTATATDSHSRQAADVDVAVARVVIRLWQWLRLWLSVTVVATLRTHCISSL